jgi:PAS domain S-box-containing protein
MVANLPELAALFEFKESMNDTINNPKPPKRSTPRRRRSIPAPASCPERAVALALRLAHAENALHALTSGQVDAIVGPGGKTYLLHGAQEDLRRSGMGLQALFDSVSDLITVINRGGEIVSQNRAAIRFLGCEPEHQVGKSFFPLIHSDDLAEVRSAFFSVIDGFRDDATVVFRHLTGDGSYRVLEAMVSKLRDASVSRAVLICRDITRRRPVREEAAPLSTPQCPGIPHAWRQDREPLSALSGPAAIAVTPATLP